MYVWFKCDFCGAVQKYDPLNVLEMRNINLGKCRACHQVNVLIPYDIKNHTEDTYIIWEMCYSCNGWKFISSCTGCCKVCDGV